MDVCAMYKEIFIDTMGLDVLGMESKFQTLVRLIETKTLTAFSQCIPALYITYLNLDDSSLVIRNDHATVGTEYVLEDPVLDKFRLPILGVEKIDYNNVGDSVDPYDPNSTAYYESVANSRNGLTLEGVLMGPEYTYNTTLTNFALPWNRYFELRGPHTLYMRNYAAGGIAEVTLKTRYPNVASIPEEFRETFIELAIYDCQIFLWNSLKYLLQVVTPSGSLDLGFDWSNAAAERKEFLKDLRSRSLPDRVGASYFRIL